MSSLFYSHCTFALMLEMRGFLSVRRGLSLLAVFVGVLRIMSVNGMGRRGRRDDRGMVIKFSDTKHIQFDERRWSKFIKCLISKEYGSCKFTLEKEKKTFYFEATEIEEDDELEEEDQVDDSVFVCNKPFFYTGSVIECKRQYLKDNSCKQLCQLFHYVWEKYCITIGWKESEARYFIPNKAGELKSSQCGGGTEEATTTVGTSRTTENITLLPALKTTTTPDSTSTNKFTDSVSINTTDAFNYARQSTGKPINPTPKSENNLSITLGLIIGLSLIFLIILVAIIVIFKKKRARASGLKVAPPTELQPYSLAGDDIDMRAFKGQGQGNTVATTPLVITSGDGDICYTTYTTMGSEYCTIPDGEREISIQTTSNEQRGTEGINSSTDNISPMVSGDRNSRTYYSEIGSTSEAIETRARQDDNSCEALNVYTALDNGRGHITAEITENILETYNAGPSAVPSTDKGGQAEDTLELYAKAKTSNEDLAVNDVKTVYSDIENSLTGKVGDMEIAIGLNDSSEGSRNKGASNLDNSKILRASKTNYIGPSVDSGNMYTRLNNGRKGKPRETTNSILETYNKGNYTDIREESLTGQSYHSHGSLDGSRTTVTSNLDKGKIPKTSGTNDTRSSEGKEIFDQSGNVYDQSGNVYDQSGNVYARLNNGRDGTTEEITQSILATYNTSSSADRDQQKEEILQPYAKAKAIHEDLEDKKVKNVYFDIESSAYEDAKGVHNFLNESLDISASNENKQNNQVQSKSETADTNEKGYSEDSNVYTRLDNGRNRVADNMTNSILETYNRGSPMNGATNKEKTVNESPSENAIKNIYFELEAEVKV